MTLLTVQADINMEALIEMGEWMAVGFYKGLELPWPRAYGLAFKRLYENVEIPISAERLLFPDDSIDLAPSRPNTHEWTVSRLICEHHHNCGLRWNWRAAEEKKAKYPQYAEFIDALSEDLRSRLPHFGNYTHSNPDMRRVVGEGLLAMTAELDEQLAQVQEEGETRNLLLALKDYAEGVMIFHRRTAEALVCAVAEATGERRTRLALIADSFANCFLTPARTFLQGLQAVHFTWLLDGCDSMGRFDQVLGPLFEQDIANGTLDLDFARELLDEFWVNCERLNGWNLQLGGYTPEGKDGANALTLECLAACARNHQRRPNVAFRVTKETPEEALLAALKVLGKGGGRPALYNDDLYVQTLLDMDLGLTPEDAREVGFGGCTETMIAGLSNVGSLEGDLNLAKELELALHDGYDPVRQCQAGPHTCRFTDFVTFKDFYAAVQRQIQYSTDAFVAQNKVDLERRFHQGDPKLPRTLFTRDCVKRGKSFEAGGARYNWAVITYQGIANCIDGLAAVRQCVFEGSIGKEELLQALDADFNGYEDVRQALQAAPKFGNDIPAVDELGHDIINYAWDELYAHETPRGGRYLASCILFATYHYAGHQVGATPDGRKAHEVLTDSVGPAQGRDTHGPTAMLHSVSRLPLQKAVGTPVLNLRFQKNVMSSPDGLRAVAALIRTFFAQGGMQAQLSVLSKEEMLAAQQRPEDHRDLIVRIGGYSEYFTNLPKELQDSVLARVEYAV